MPVEAVEWERFWQRKGGGLKAGQHVSVFGPTGTGKTYALVWFCESFASHAILVVTKGADELVERLASERGWLVAREPGEIFAADGRPGPLLRQSLRERFVERREKGPQRIVFMPKVPAGSLRNRADYLADQVEVLLDRAYEYCRSAKSHRVFVAIDETMFAAMELNMTRPFVMFWNEGRSMGLSFGAAMQRPAWIPKSSKSSPTYVLVFDTSDPDDLLELAKLAGMQRAAELREELDRLGDYEHLMILTRTRPREVVRSRVVIRKKGRETADAA